MRFILLAASGDIIVSRSDRCTVGLINYSRFEMFSVLISSGNFLVQATIVNMLIFRGKSVSLVTRTCL